MLLLSVPRDCSRRAQLPLGLLRLQGSLTVMQASYAMRLHSELLNVPFSGLCQAAELQQSRALLACACDMQVRQAMRTQPLPLPPQVSMVGSCARHNAQHKWILVPIMLELLQALNNYLRGSIR